MNEDANDIFKSLLAKANRNLVSECAELRAKLKAADHRAAINAEAVDKLTESAEKWAIDAARESERADAAEARVKELEAHLASERGTREALIQHGLELETRLHACALNRDMNGECCVCGSVDEKIAAAQREADERHATRQQGGAL